MFRPKEPAGSVTRGNLPIHGGGNGNGGNGGGNGGGPAGGGNQPGRRARQIQLIARAAREVTRPNSETALGLETIHDQCDKAGKSFSAENLVTFARGADGRVAYLEVGQLDHILSGDKGAREAGFLEKTGFSGMGLANEIARVASTIPVGETITNHYYSEDAGMRVKISDRGNGWIVTAHPKRKTL